MKLSNLGMINYKSNNSYHLQESKQMLTKYTETIEIDVNICMFDLKHIYMC